MYYQEEGTVDKRPDQELRELAAQFPQLRDKQREECMEKAHEVAQKLLHRLSVGNATWLGQEIPLK